MRSLAMRQFGAAPAVRIGIGKFDWSSVDICLRNLSGHCLFCVRGQSAYVK